VATVAQPDREALRRLAEVSVPDGAVLSVYVNLDPSEFATADARSSAIGSAVNEAQRAVGDEGALDHLSHAARVALRADVEQVREYLESADFDGTQGIAIFAAGGADLFEALHLPFPVANAVKVDAAPHVAPLADESEGAWLVVLVNRRNARLFRGGPERLREEGRVEDDVHGQHDQGGWSQARYERSVDQDAQRHLERTARAVFQRHQRKPFDHLLVGAPDDSYNQFVDLLDKGLRDRLRGRVESDVENVDDEQVTEAAAPAIAEYERQRQGELIARLNEGLGRGERAAAGLEGVLRCLNEQRVEVLLLEAGFSAEGVQCPQCGWIGVAGTGKCPADESELEPRPDVVDAAIERALAQDAELTTFRDRPEIESHGGIAAILRF
jgi:peptide subunit release factor 1 (eRF1)